VQIGTLVVAQAKTLAEGFPDMMAKFKQPSVMAPAAFNELKAQLIDAIRTNWAQRTAEIMRELPAAGMKFVSVASNLVFVVIVPVLAFFFLKDGDAIRRHILETLDGGQLRAVVDSVMSDIHILLAQYMRALVLLSLATFTAYAFFFTIIKMPFGVLLAVLAMFLEFMPMIGPLTAAATILLVTLVSGAPFWQVAVFLIAYRMFQDYLLSPHLMSQGAALHPLLVLLGVFGGAEVAGVAGSFLSVPVLATARILYIRTRRSMLAVPSTAPPVVPGPETIVETNVLIP
jgi:predicted PurR-regulated permease PerM